MAALAVHAWRRRSSPGALAFAIMALLTLPWFAAASLQLAASMPADREFWGRMQRLWQLPVQSASLWFVLDYSNLNQWLTRRVMVALAVPIVLAGVLVFTGDADYLVWRGISLEGGWRAMPSF